MRGILGIDVGTTHIKSMLFDTDGTVIAERIQKTPISADKYGSVYRPAEIWNIVKAQLNDLLQQTKAVIGISITGMAEAGLIVNRKTKQEETDIIPWYDRRTCALAETISLKEEVEIFDKTGLRNSYKYGIYKFLWLLSEKKIDRQDAVWLSMCDFLAWKLTGKFATEPGFAARTYVYDIKNGCWDWKRIKSYGLDVENFPCIVPSGSIVGHFRTEAGQMIPVVIAGHDHVCAAFSILFHDTGGICDSAGTSETYIGRLDGMEAFGLESGLLYGPFLNEGFFYMANIPSSGHSVEWFTKKLQWSELSYERMNQELEKRSHEPTGILYFPYLTGMGSPWYQADMKGTFLGIGEDMDGWTVLRGILEGIQYQAAWMLSILEQRHGITFEKIYCAGGSVNNSAMMQIKADVLSKQIVVPERKEATLFGAAALFLYKNESKSAAECFLARSHKIQAVYSPDEVRSKKYRDIWNRKYFPMAKMLRDFYNN